MASKLGLDCVKLWQMEPEDICGYLCFPRGAVHLLVAFRDFNETICCVETGGKGETILGWGKGTGAMTATGCKEPRTSAHPLMGLWSMKSPQHHLPLWPREVACLEPSSWDQRGPSCPHSNAQG